MHLFPDRQFVRQMFCKQVILRNVAGFVFLLNKSFLHLDVTIRQKLKSVAAEFKILGNIVSKISPNKQIMKCDSHSARCHRQ